MDNTEFIDFMGDSDIRQPRRRRLLRVVVPVAGVIVMLVAILAIATVSYQSNRRDALVLSNDLLQALDRRIALEVKNYLAPASEMAELAAGVLREGWFKVDHDTVAESLGISILTNYPQLAFFNFADTGGNFMALRKKSDGSVDSLIIDRRQNTVRSTMVRRDPQGRVTGTRSSDETSYDPRGRPWYLGAIQDRKLYWTDVYVFYGRRNRAGVTASYPIIGERGDILGALGLDIRLEQLSTFLADLEIGATGRAMILDEKGRLVAYPKPEQLPKRNEGEPQPLLYELDDPVLSRAFDRFQVEGYGWREFRVDGQRYISTTTSLRSTVGREWSILIVVPEQDFVGFVAQNNRRTLAMSAIVLGLAALLAGLLSYQGLQADRNAQLVLERQRQLDAQGRAFSELVSGAELFDPARPDSLVKLTEVVCRTAGARRVSLWRLIDGGRRLVCDDCYDRENDGHTQGSLLTQNDLPPLFDALNKPESLMVANAAEDPRTAGLYRIYLHAFACQALLATPIAQRQRVIGWVWLEGQTSPSGWAPGADVFALAVANMLALRLMVSAGAADASTEAALAQEPGTGAPVRAKETVGTTAMMVNTAPRQALRVSALSKECAGSFRERLAARGLDQEAIGAHIFPHATVLVAQFNDAVSLAERLGAEETSPLVDHLIRRLEELAVSHEIEYLRLVSDEIVCASGFDEDPDRAAHALADLALELQEYCVRLFAGLHHRSEFRFGIDTGVAIGSFVGRGQRSFNLWGEAVQAASRMAEAGLPGCIQVTESTYGRLRDRYLFQVRGSYYLQDVGELSTFILAGRM